MLRLVTWTLCWPLLLAILFVRAKGGHLPHWAEIVAAWARLSPVKLALCWKACRSV